MILKKHPIHEARVFTIATFFDTENEYEKFQMTWNDKLFLIYKIITTSRIVGIVTHKKLT